MVIKNAGDFFFEEHILLVGDAIFNGLGIPINAERYQINSGVNAIFYEVNEKNFKGISIDSNAILSLGDDTTYEIELRGIFPKKEISYGLHDELEKIAEESNYKYEINSGARSFTVSTNLRKGDVLPLVQKGETLQISKIFRQMLDNLTGPAKKYIR